MIGFDPELHDNQPLPEEGADTRNLSKSALYDRVAEVYCVPPYSSRGVTREWLLGVLNHTFFRVENEVIRIFEFGLTRAQQKKVGITNNALLVKKLNRLLESQNNRWLGFTEHDVPEQNWLYRITRFVDQNNLLEFFQMPCTQPPPLEQNSPPIIKMHYGRKYACQWLFRLQQVRGNKKLWDALRMLSETYRQLASYTINQELLERELQDTRNKIVALTSTLTDQVNKAAFTYTTLENPNIRPELIIMGGDGLTADMRNQLNTNVKL